MGTPQGHSEQSTAAGPAQWICCYGALSAIVPASEVLSLSLAVHILSRNNQLSECIRSLLSTSEVGAWGILPPT